MTKAEQVQALTEQAGLYRRIHRRVVKVSGADRRDFLQRMLSQDVLSLTPGQAARSCVLDARARLLGDPIVWCFEDALFLDLDADAANQAVPHLVRFVIGEDVVFEDVTAEGARYVLAGPAAAAAWPDLESGRHRDDVLRLDLGGCPAFELLALPADPRSVTGVPVVEEAAFDVLRVEECVPAWGKELGPEVMPLEARLGDTAISWSKGCFPGHEPVAKARFRGHPPHLLVRLGFSAPASEGATLTKDGRGVGRVTTAVEDPRDGAWRGLGYVRSALLEERPRLHLDGDESGEVEILE